MNLFGTYHRQSRRSPFLRTSSGVRFCHPSSGTGTSAATSDHGASFRPLSRPPCSDPCKTGTAHIWYAQTNQIKVNTMPYGIWLFDSSSCIRATLITTPMKCPV